MRGLLVASLATSAAAFGVAPAPRGRVASPRASPQMAGGTPRVPWKAPGMENPQWIDVFNRMYRERIMFLGQSVDDNFANTIIAVLLYLESEDAKAPASMYFNVGGGVMKSGLAVYDTMRIMPYEIQTVNMGMCAQVSAFLVAGGTKSKRYALPNARFAMQVRCMGAAVPFSVAFFLRCRTESALRVTLYVVPTFVPQNPSIMPPLDEKGNPVMRPMQATEMKLEVEETLRDKKRMIEGFSSFTGRPIEHINQDFLRDFYLTADEAVQYGLVDQLLLPKRPEKIASKGDLKWSV